MRDIVESLEHAKAGLEMAAAAWRARGGKWVVEGNALDAIGQTIAHGMTEITRLRAECFSLAAWACIHPDGKTGIVNDEHGNQYCAKDAELTRLRAEVERLQEALTPSGATKAAYIGEFHFTDSYIGEDGNDVDRKVAVPWTTVKEIMVAIRARAALTAQEKTDGK